MTKQIKITTEFCSFFNKKGGITAFLSFFLIFCFSKTTFSANSVGKSVSTIEAFDEIQKTLLFSDENSALKKSKKVKSSLSINRSNKSTKPDIQIIVKDREDKDSNQKQKLAYSSFLAEQYEVAIQLYTQILKSNPDDKYSKFVLASSYHMLGQYKQAKNLYYQLIKCDWQDDKIKEDVLSSFISLIVEESPVESVYLLSRLSNENPQSAYIISGAAMAYEKVGNLDKAILLLKRAIDINPEEIQYKFNLAVIYDKMGEYKNALNSYQDTLDSYVSGEDADNSIPIVEIRQRIQFIKNKLQNEN